MELQHMVAAGRMRSRQGPACAGGDYDLLACLADAAAAAPLGAPALQIQGVPHRQEPDRNAAAQTGPPSDSQMVIRRHASAGRVSPSPPADMDVVGTSSLHTEREVRVTCNGTLGIFLLPSQTVQCHCARCAPEGASGDSHGTGDAADAQPQHHHHHAPAITPTEFERHSGLLTAKKWRNSIRLLQSDGAITIGKWLEQHNILPRPKCSGPLGSPAPVGSGGMAFPFGYGPEGFGHHGGPSSGNDTSHTAGGGALYGHGHGGRGGGGGSSGWTEPHAAHAQLGRCTLPPSRYPASEYVTGEDDEYDEVGAQLAGGGGAYGHPAGEEVDGGGVDGDDHEDGLYGDPAEAAGGRGSRRSAAHRGARSVGGAAAAGLKATDRRGQGRTAGRQAAPSTGGGGGSRASSARATRGRLAAAAAAAVAAQQALQGRADLVARVGNSLGVGPAALRRASGSGAGRGTSSQEEGGEEEEGGGGGGGGGKGHSSSEGSPPSDDSKRRGGGGSGGSGEGDGSGTGDGGDSRRPGGPAGMEERERRAAEEAPGCARRTMRHGAAAATKALLQQQQQLQYPEGREGFAGVGGAMQQQQQDRSARHAAAIKRPPPSHEYRVAAESGQGLKRPRMRPTNGAGGAGGDYGLGGEELAELYDMAAAAPRVCGWRFLGASPDPTADQVLISVTINGKTYTGLLAPQQPVPAPQPLPQVAAAAATTAAAGLRAQPLAAPAGSNAGCCGGAAAVPAISGRKAAGVGGSGGSGRALTTWTGRTNLPPVCPSSRLGFPPGAGMASAAGQEDGEVPPRGPEDLAATVAAAAAAAPGSVAVEDEHPDDGMPPNCPRCALCHRCASPLLALPPPTPTPAPAPSSSPSSARATAPATTAPDATTVPAAPGVGAEGQGSPETAMTAATTAATPAAVNPPDSTAAVQSQREDQRLDVATPAKARQQPATVEPLLLPAAVAAVVAGPSETWAACGSDGGNDVGAAAAGSGTLPAADAVAGVITTTITTTCSAGSSAQQEAAAGAAVAGAAAVATRKPSLCASSSNDRQPEATAAAEASPELPEPPAAPATKVEVELKSEGNSADTAAPGPAGATQQTQGQQPAAAAAEASRTSRQAGCGLGPLVEVRCGSGDGGAVGSAVVVHSQCALWSAEVFVIAGAVYGVPAVVKRSRGQRCAHCGRFGATLCCCSAKCGRTYHLPCAMEAGAMLVAEPYSMACPLHRSAAVPHSASSSGPQIRQPPSRLRPTPSQDASQSTAATTTVTAATATTTETGGAPQPHPHPLLQSQGHQQQQQQQVPLPSSLQAAAGRRVVLPPMSAAVAPPLPRATAAGGSRIGTDAANSSLPALMMHRTQADRSRAQGSELQLQMSSMPPPVAEAATAPAPADTPAGTPTDNGHGSIGGCAEGCDGCGGGAVELQRPAEAGEQGPAKRYRLSQDVQCLAGGDGSGGVAAVADVPADSNGGGSKAAAAALAISATPWTQMQPPVFERRQAAAAAAAAAATAAAAAGGIAMLANLYGGGAAAMTGLSSGQLEMSSVASEGVAAVNSKLHGDQAAQGATAAAARALKRRWEPDAGEGGADAAAAAAGERQQQPPASGPAQPSPSKQQQSRLPPPSPLTVGPMPPMFLARSGGPAATAAAAATASNSADTTPGDTLGLGLGLGLDPSSGLHLSHASALKLLQQHPHLGGALPEGVAAMLLAAHHNHHSNAASSGDGGGGGLRQGGARISLGSPGSTATQTQQPARGMPGGGGRPRHHHHHHHHHHSSTNQLQVLAAARASISTASGSTGTGFGRGSGGGCDEVPSPHFHALQQQQQQLLLQPNGSVSAGVGVGAGCLLAHMLPRAARNIESLLPSRPLLHNPYVPSSGDPSADLALSKIAQNGSREVEAELLGGTTGRAGHSGRCAVCVIQRKGKCGTESAPKKCLRRQLVALQRATGASTNVSLVCLSGAGGLSCGGGEGGAMVTNDEEGAKYAADAGVGGAADATDADAAGGGGSPALHLEECIAVAAAEQRARERARRETWSLPLGQGSGATGKRPLPPQQLQQQPQQQFVAM